MEETAGVLGRSVPEEESTGLAPEETLTGSVPDRTAAAPDREPDLETLIAEARRGIEQTEDASERKEESARETAPGTADRSSFPGKATETPATRKKPGKSRFWIILLLLVFIGAGVGAAVYYLRPAADRGAPDPGVRRLSFEAVGGSFVESKEAGILFVIRGKVKNNYPEDRSLIRVKANVLNDKGQVVRQKTAYAGSVYQDEEIRVLPMPEIVKAMNNRKGMAGENMKVAPGASVGFMIVFEGLPDNLSEFTVEAVSSSPAMP
jgi:hypothetical protein